MPSPETTAPPPIPPVAADARTSLGPTLAEITDASPVLLLFLRHFGCTFCREAASDIARDRDTLAERGVTPCFVYMPGTPHDPTTDQQAAADRKAQRFFARYGLQDLPRIPDPTQALYHAFELKRGSLAQLFGPRVWLRGFSAGVLHKHGVGTLTGDGFQMPGAFILHNRRILHAYRHHSAADRPDYCELV